MGDTSERSKPSGLPPRCPCGFWGSSKTMNLCSKCFSDIQKKPPGDDRPSKSASPSAAFAGEPVVNAGKSPAVSASPEAPADEEPSPLFGVSAEDERAGEARPSEPAEHVKARHLLLAAAAAPSGTTRTPTKRPPESASTLESEATPEKRPRAEAKDGEGGGGEEEEEEEEEESGGGGGCTPKQKNRRRCFSCQSKLELVQQELGSCRCGYVFCMLHRLPEQHDCLFDHLGRGREEAVLKMVKLERKVGRSCQRIGEECS
ncbi:AN1-type zinc finger protein 3-like [Stigmatopora argus]